MRQLAFVIAYLGSIPTVFLSAYAGALVYKWLEYIPPIPNYHSTLPTEQTSLLIGALTFLVWLFKEKKALPPPRLLFLLLAVFWICVNATTLYALAPEAAAEKWERTVKLIGFALLTAHMTSSRVRLEAFVWVFVFCTAWSAVPP